jgi:hypothetical protein
MPVPKYDRTELRPDGFKIEGGSVPHEKKGQSQPTGPYKEGSGGGNNGKSK